MSSTFKNEKRVPRSVILIQYFLEHLLSLNSYLFYSTKLSDHRARSISVLQF